VTCGEAVGRSDGEAKLCKKDSGTWDPYASYGMRLARALDAQAHLVCYGGRGLVRDWRGRSNVRAYVAEAVRRTGDARVLAVPARHFPGDACNEHPTAAQHADMARDLEPVIREAMGWTAPGH
jgi:hypothetical protein